MRIQTGLSPIGVTRRRCPELAHLCRLARCTKVVCYLKYCRRADQTAAIAVVVKVFRRRPSQTSHRDSGRRLKTSKERNRVKGHVLGGACALTMGI
jgi:hypothetical protein